MSQEPTKYDAESDSEDWPHEFGARRFLWNPPNSSKMSRGGKRYVRELYRDFRANPGVYEALAALVLVPVGVLTLGLTILTVILTRQTAEYARNQAELARVQAEAAQQANEITQQNSRARVARVEGFQILPQPRQGAKRTILVRFKNVGQAPAFNLQSGFEVRKWLGMPEGDMPVKISGSGEMLQAGDPFQVELNDLDPATAQFPGGLPSGSVTQDPKEATSYFFGRFEYESFGKRHRTEFCFFMTRFGPFQCRKWHSAD